MKIAVLAGDGIGPEVTREAVRSINSVASVTGLDLEIAEAKIGGTAIDTFGVALPDETADLCLKSDAVLLGSVGDPKFDDLPPNKRPEIGLLGLRKILGGFANLRPSKAITPLISSSPLRSEIFIGTDLLIVRELLGGLYFGEPRGFEADGNSAFNTMRYSAAEVERVARIAFETAMLRRKKVTSVDKANVLEVSQIWRSTVDKVALDFPEIELEHLFVDACAMHLVTAPSQFDVILTENLFGDILSDEAAVLTGSLGMLASATIGSNIGLFEPVHGSAPQIADQNIANPIGAISSAALLLRYSAQNERAACAIEDAITSVLEDGFRTADIAEPTCTNIVTTSEMGTLISERAASLALDLSVSKGA